MPRASRAIGRGPRRWRCGSGRAPARARAEPRQRPARPRWRTALADQPVSLRGRAEAPSLTDRTGRPWGRSRGSRIAAHAATTEGLAAPEDLRVRRVRVGLLRPLEEPVRSLVRVRLGNKVKTRAYRARQAPCPLGSAWCQCSPSFARADSACRGGVWQNDALSPARPDPLTRTPQRPSRNRPWSPPGDGVLTTHNVQGDTTDVAVKIRLKRLGKVRVPQYRIVVVDSRKKRDGRVIEEIGKYHPKEDPSYIDVVSDRAQYWLGVGAQPSEAVAGSSRSPVTGRSSRACRAPRAPSRSPSPSATSPRSSTRRSRTPPASPRPTR